MLVVFHIAVCCTRSTLCYVLSPQRGQGTGGLVCILTAWHGATVASSLSLQSSLQVCGRRCPAWHGGAGAAGRPRDASRCVTLSSTQPSAPKRPRGVSVTSPLCSARYRFYVFQRGRCTAYLRPIDMLQDHYPTKCPLI